MARAKGCLEPRFPPHLTRASFRLHPAAPMTPPPSYDLRTFGFVPPVKDQGPTGSCNGHRSSTCIETTCRAQGHSLSFTPSEEDIYRCAREIDRARNTPMTQALPPLTDSGSMTDDVIQAVGVYGIRARYTPIMPDGRNSDVDPTTVNDEQSIHDLEADAACLVTGEYAIDPLAPDMVMQVKTAIASGNAVGVDFFCDTTFELWGENWTAGAAPCGPPNKSDPQGGGHAISLVGYLTEADGSTTWILRNSWGIGIGDAGDWYVSTAWLEAAWAIYVFNVRVIGG